MIHEDLGRGLTLAEAPNEMALRAMGSPVAKPGSQVVIYTCGRCGEASREVREETIPVSEEAVAQALEDAEFVDLRGRTRRAKTILLAVRARVIARDRCRCRVCGTRVWKHVHHADPRRSDEHALPLCARRVASSCTGASS